VLKNPNGPPYDNGGGGGDDDDDDRGTIGDGGTAQEAERALAADGVTYPDGGVASVASYTFGSNSWDTDLILDPLVLREPSKSVRTTFSYDMEGDPSYRTSPVGC